MSRLITLRGCTAERLVTAQAEGSQMVAEATLGGRSPPHCGTQRYPIPMDTPLSGGVRGYAKVSSTGTRRASGQKESIGHALSRRNPGHHKQNRNKKERREETMKALRNNPSLQARKSPGGQGPQAGSGRYNDKVCIK